MGYRSHDYDTIKNQFRALRRMDIEWDVINEDGNKVWTNTSPLSLARIIEGAAICEYEFTPSLVPYLIKPAQYAVLSLAVQARFKSLYGLVLYENCERYRKIGRTKKFDINQFRLLMGLGERQYQNFFAMKNRVIEKAISETNKYANFDIKAKYEKNGRNVSRIQFLIKPKDIFEGEGVHISNLAEILSDEFGISSYEVDKLLKTYSEEYICEKIKLVKESETFRSGRVKSVASYLRSYLKGDFRPPKTSQDMLNEMNSQRWEQKEQDKKRIKCLEQIKKEYNAYLNDYINQIVSDLNKAKKDEYMNKFKDNLRKTNAIIYDACRKQNFESKMAIGCFNVFFQKNYPELLSGTQSFTEYVEQHYPDDLELINATTN
jgi:hypothetical protein